MDKDAGEAAEDVRVAHVFDDDGSEADNAEVESQLHISKTELNPDRTGSADEEGMKCEEEAQENEDGSDDDAVQDDVSYARLCSRGTAEAATDAARDWLLRVRVDGPGAMATALCLVVDAARPGVKPREPLISPGMLLANDPATSVVDICESMAEDTSDKSRFFVKKGRVAYEAFWRALVNESERATLHDTDCFEMLVLWLGEMSVASSRPLRLTACAAAYAIVNGLISVGLDLRAKLETSTLQLETENKNSAKKGESAKGKKLKDDVYLFETDLAEIDDLKQKVFASILTLKYRDVSPEVRAASVVALIDWALRDTAIFLGDSHNKYAGWVLFDKTPYVRRTALESITRLFEGTKSASSLEVFLSRFRDRIVAMSGDSDTDVCVAAVNLCTVLVPLEAFVGKLNDSNKIKEAKQDNVESICALTSSDNKEVRKAAGVFAAAIVKLSSDGDENPSSPQLVTSAGSSMKKRRGRPKKNDMVKLLDESKKKKKKSKLAETAATGIAMDVEKAKGDIREVIFTVLGDDAGDVAASGLVLEAVWEHLPAAHCWAAYCELLSEYNGASKTRKSTTPGGVMEDEDQLGRNDMVSVAGLLLAAAKQVSQGPRKRGHGKTDVTEVFSEERTQLTSCFLPTLPMLMTSYRTEPLVLQLLAELPCSFDLSCCFKSSSSGDFKKMLAKLGDVLARSTGSPDVITAAAQTMKQLSLSDEVLANEASVALRKEVTNAARALHAVVRTDTGKGTQAATSAAILRSHVLSELVDVPKPVADDAAALLRMCCEQKGTSIDPAASVNVCRLVANSLMWESAGLVSSAITTDGRDIDEDSAENAIRSFAVRRDEVLHLFSRLLKMDSIVDVCVRHAAFNSICLITSISVGVHSRLSASIRQAESDSSHGPTPSRQTVDLMAVDLDEDRLSEGLAICFRAMIASRFQRRRENHSIEEFANSSVALVEKEGRDMLAGLCQVAFVGALPADIVCIPLLGLLLKGKRRQLSHGSGVSGFDMAKLYYSRLKATIPVARISLLEQQVLFEAARLDEKASTDSDSENLRAVQTLASFFLREYSSSALGSKSCDMLLMGLAGSAFPPSVRLSSIDVETASLIKRTDASLRRSAVLVAGSVLAPRLSKAVAASLLAMWDDVDAREGEEHSLSEFRRHLEAVSIGKAIPATKRMKPSMKGKKIQKRRRVVKQKNHSERKRSRKRKQSDDVDPSTVRRSGRTQRVAYVEPESDESESEGEFSDVPDEEDGSYAEDVGDQRVAGPPNDAAEESEDNYPPASSERSNVALPTAVVRTPTRKKRKASSEAVSPRIRKSPRVSAKNEVLESSLKSPQGASAVSAGSSQRPAKRKRSDTGGTDATRESSLVEDQMTKASPRRLRAEELAASSEVASTPQRTPRKTEENESQSSGAVRKSPRLASQKDLNNLHSPVPLPAVKRSKRGRRW